MNVLLLGRTAFDHDQTLDAIRTPDIVLFTGTSIDDVRRAFEQAPINAVIMGAGLDIDTRCEVVRLVVSVSDSTTIHLKDRDSGKAGMMPFVNRVLSGLNPGGRDL